MTAASVTPMAAAVTVAALASAAAVLAALAAFIAAAITAFAAFIAAAMASFAMAASITTAVTAFAVAAFAMAAVAAMTPMTAVAAMPAFPAFVATVIVAAVAAVIMIVVVAVISAPRWRRQRSRLIIDIGAALHQRIAEPNRTQRVEPRRTDDVRRTIIAERKIRLFVCRRALGAATLRFAALQRGDDLRDCFRRDEKRLRHRPAARRANAIA